MKYFNPYAFISILLLSLPMIGLCDIQFVNLNVETAIKKAKTEHKLVFVDTYATWCSPCKIMDRVFEDPDVSDYFNTHFVNVKIDMDGTQGKKMLHEYEVVWLPTLLILDGTGNVLVKIDKILTATELIEIAKNARSGIQTMVGTSLQDAPFSMGGRLQAEERDYDPSDMEEIIYVYNEKTSSGRPHIMYHEAYLHLQLMDGQHQKVVQKYLSTQEDWNTEKNIKFIFDFLQDVRSKEFEYFITHKARFEEVIGADKVKQTIHILVQQRLRNGFPRPSYDEAKKLYALLNPNPTRAELLAKQYAQSLDHPE